MASAKRGYKCKLCRQMQTRHREVSEGVFECDDGKVAVFERFITNPTRQSTSFDTAQLDFLQSLFATLLRGGDTSVFMRRPELARVLVKFQAMHGRSVAARNKEGGV